MSTAPSQFQQGAAMLSGDKREQKSLFEAAAPWEQDEKNWKLVASVVFAGPVEGEFDYLVPENLQESIGVGLRVRVPFGAGNKPKDAYCIRLEHKDTQARRLKTVASVVDGRSLLSPAMIRLTQWIAHHYLCSWGQVLEAVVPAGVRGLAGTRKTQMVEIPAAVKARLDITKLPEKQAKIMRLLLESDEPLTVVELARSAESTTAPIKSLIKKGLLTCEVRRLRTVKVDDKPAARVENLALNPEQQNALGVVHQALHEGKHQTILLRGVTGSGKTEVYIQAIQEVVRFGRQAIVLVPEISLTPQTVERFRSRFDQVAVLHSHLSDSERHYHWERIAAGQVSVVVGARSAVFAPTPHLGLMILDEEHENSFKQETLPRYHARDVALQRSLAENVPLVLGSATPSLESWQKAVTGEYRLVELPHRIQHRPLPAVRTIDLRQEMQSAHKMSSKGAISRRLRVQMEQALAQGGQVILLLNRRGFATHIQCHSCGHVVRCQSCDIALTWHREGNMAMCHYCDYTIPTLIKCPECNYTGIKYSGLGTQKLEAEVRSRFPQYVCLRMDTDTMTSPGSHERALAKFRAGEVQILLGTQMIAKGLDFPSVTLVGVINADMALHLPDFRASERTFQLLVQVAGRTGRGDQGGRVLVQTFCPDHPAIQAATMHDYIAFAKDELPMRQALGYPPFGSMIRLVVRGLQETPTMHFAEHITDLIRNELTPHLATVRLLGPAPAPIAKLRDKFRFNINLLGPDGPLLRAAVRAATANIKAPDDMDWMIDVDPLSML